MGLESSCGGLPKALDEVLSRDWTQSLVCIGSKFYLFTLWCTAFPIYYCDYFYLIKCKCIRLSSFMHLIELLYSLCVYISYISILNNNWCREKRWTVKFQTFRNTHCQTIYRKFTYLHRALRKWEDGAYNIYNYSNPLIPSHAGLRLFPLE